MACQRCIGKLGSRFAFGLAIAESRRTYMSKVAMATRNSGYVDGSLADTQGYNRRELAAIDVIVAAHRSDWLRQWHEFFG